MTMRSLAALFALAASLGLTAQAGPAARQVISRVENALLASGPAKNQPLQTTTLAARMRELKVPGVGAAVFRDGRIEWAQGWGMADVDSGRAVDRDTRFQAASISKPVAAATVLALVSQGRLSLDTDVNTLLTSWKVPANEHTAAAPVTLRRLLSHSAGTTVHGFRGYASDEAVPTLVQLLNGVKPANSAAVRVDIPVGSQWRYSGGGISIAQLVVEDVTKKPFAEVARELVLEPLGMTSSTYVQPLPTALRGKAATGYKRTGQAVPGKWHTYPEQAAAGLWTTPEDLARFAIGLQMAAAGTSKKVMSQAVAQDMLRRQAGEYGLGIAVMGEAGAPYFGHNGANEGFRATWFGYRDRASGVVVMTNGDLGSALAADIVRTVASEYAFRGLSPSDRSRVP